MCYFVRKRLKTPTNGRNIPKLFLVAKWVQKDSRKKGLFFIHIRLLFRPFYQNFRLFWGPKKPENPKFRPILAKKQYLLKKFFTNFFCVSWRISTEILMIIPPIPAELSQCAVLNPRIVTASCLAPHDITIIFYDEKTKPPPT